MALSSRILQPGFDELTQAKLGPIGRDIQRRGIRVTRRMKELASGIEGGPQIRSGNLLESIAFLEFGFDAGSLFAKIGPQPHRAIRRGWNYPLLLEQGFVHTSGKFVGPFKFMEPALQAARD